MTGTSLNIAVTAQAGEMIAVNKALATLPLAMQFIGTMAATVPASLMMRRYGRRLGLSCGAIAGILGGLLSAYAIYLSDLSVLVAGGFLLGCFNASAMYYRFTAVDVADHSFKARAISYVMAGGVIAAICGPTLATWSRPLLEPVLFAGSFYVVAGLAVITLIFIQFIRVPPLRLAERKDTGRPLVQIARQPVFVVAVLGAMVGYASMSFIMTATPLAIVGCGFDPAKSDFVIQWHALGMFAPAFITPRLIERFGVLRVMFVGAVLEAACVGVALSGITLTQFWFALVLLGLGWNFLFIGATTLLTETYVEKEKAKVQAMNDFLVFGLVSCASLLSGVLYSTSGWAMVNLGVLPMLIVTGAVILWLMAVRRPDAPVGSD